jgi:ribosomal protein S18 acetylase RimI-like enzyme
MIINNTIGVKKNSLSSEYVPISYWDILTPYQRRKSIEVVIYDKYKNIIGVGRNLYISYNSREISDIWISPKYRGKSGIYKSKKLSHHLIEILIDTIKDKRHSISKIVIVRLEVHKENISAIKLYKNYNFYTICSSQSRKNWIKQLGFKRTITMSRSIIF